MVSYISFCSSKKIIDGTMSTRKYKQVVSSIHEIGLIEPLSVIQPDPKKSEFLLLDGHSRVGSEGIRHGYRTMPDGQR